MNAWQSQGGGGGTQVQLGQWRGCLGTARMGEGSLGLARMREGCQGTIGAGEGGPDTIRVGGARAQMEDGEGMPAAAQGLRFTPVQGTGILGALQGGDLAWLKCALHPDPWSGSSGLCPPLATVPAP